jgi:hypothetical protein
LFPQVRGRLDGPKTPATYLRKQACLFGGRGGEQHEAQDAHWYDGGDVTDRRTRRHEVQSLQREAERVRRLLLDWDFLGIISAGAPTDEYDCIVWPLTRMLCEDAAIDQIVHFLRAEASDHFGIRMSELEARGFVTRAQEQCRSGADEGSR